MIGGITAVAWTNVAQGIILSSGRSLILGRVLLAPEIGDPMGIIKSSWDAGKYSFGSWEFSWRMLFDRETTTIWIFFFAYFIQWSRRYVTDQHIVQHYLIAKSDRAASRGAFLGALSCLPIFFTFMFIGASFYGFFDLLPGDAGPPQSGRGHAVFPLPLHPERRARPDPGRHPGRGHVVGQRGSQQYCDRIDHRLFRQYLAQGLGEDEALFGRSMVVAGGVLASTIAVLLLPKEGSEPLMQRAITIATIISGGTLGLFSSGFLTRRATRTGAYAGIAACLIFTSWALLSKPDGAGGRVVDFGFNWEMNTILIGVFGHFVLFVIGYLVSLIFGRLSTGERRDP